MGKKAFALLLSLAFLFSGGLCSLFLLDANKAWPVIGLVMVALCIWGVVDAILWVTKNRSTLPASTDPEALSPTTKLLIVTGLVVISVYAACWGGMLELRLG